MKFMLEVLTVPQEGPGGETQYKLAIVAPNESAARREALERSWYNKLWIVRFLSVLPMVA